MIGQIHISELPPPASATGPVTSVPVLVADSPFPVLRAARPGMNPLETARGATCHAVRGACFTSQFIKDTAKSNCVSGIRSERIPGKGCPIGSPRIDSYGSFADTSASQFDPCRIKDFPVCSGGSRFGDMRSHPAPVTIEYGASNTHSFSKDITRNLFVKQARRYRRIQSPPAPSTTRWLSVSDSFLTVCGI